MCQATILDRNVLKTGLKAGRGILVVALKPDIEDDSLRGSS